MSERQKKKKKKKKNGLVEKDEQREEEEDGLGVSMTMMRQGETQSICFATKQAQEEQTTRNGRRSKRGEEEERKQEKKRKKTKKGKRNKKEEKVEGRVDTEATAEVFGCCFCATYTAMKKGKPDQNGFARYLLKTGSSRQQNWRLLSVFSHLCVSVWLGLPTSSLCCFITTSPRLCCPPKPFLQTVED